MGWGPSEGPGRPGPYLLGGREAGQSTQVGGVSDEHGLRKQARVGVLGHLRLVAVEGWPGGRREGGKDQTPWARLGPSREGLKAGRCVGGEARGLVSGPMEQWLGTQDRYPKLGAPDRGVRPSPQLQDPAQAGSMGGRLGEDRNPHPPPEDDRCDRQWEA